MRRVFYFQGVQTEDGFVGHEREDVRQNLLDLEGALYQLGGAVTISAIREQIGPDDYMTTGMVVAYDSFTPAAKRPPEDLQSGSDELQIEPEEAIADGSPRA